MIIDDPDPTLALPSTGYGRRAPCIYRVIVDPDPATHAAGEAILGPSAKLQLRGNGSGIFERPGRVARITGPAHKVLLYWTGKPGRFADSLFVSGGPVSCSLLCG
jgi:hypothetical protein